VRCVIESLTFTLVDDITLGIQSKALDATNLPRVTAEDLGPLIELKQTGLIEHPADWLHAGRHASLLCGLANGGKWFNPAGWQGFVSVNAIKADYTNWTDFAMRAKRAAVESGFADDPAGQLVAAIGELHTNILEHSEHEYSGYLVFDATPKRFEFVVADAGIGILQSLRTHPHFAYVKDSGTALELALSEGVSRFYDDKDRGRGFRPIFIGLANASNHLRFRSADHSREIVREHDGRLLATTHQRASLKGFLCSALCEAL
jgi:anti-sigma regulatory factor (Ser/Thr protein kinase)